MEPVPLEALSQILISYSSFFSVVSKPSTVSSVEYIAIFVCLLLSMFFSASETALTAIHRLKIEQWIDKNPKKYKSFDIWLKTPNRVLTTILIGNNIVNIFASALATQIAEALIGGSKGIAVAIGVMTFLILMFGEILPKTYAKHHAEKVALLILPMLKLSYFLFFPLTWTLVKFTKTIIRTFGGSIDDAGPFVTEEDIQFMIDVGTREGVLHTEKEKMLQSVFEFDDRVAREIMQPRTNIIGIAMDSTWEEAMELARNTPYSRIPVFRDNLDQIEGVLNLRDLFRHKMTANEKERFEWKSLIRPTFFIPGSIKISILLQEFQKRKYHQAVIVDEFGGTMGLVTLEDILEEIVGEINDEYDPEEERDFEKLDGGDYSVDATMNLRDLGEEMDLDFPEDGDYETLAGFLLSLEGMLPSNGECLYWEGYKFKIVEVDERAIKRVVISQYTEEEEQQQKSKPSYRNLQQPSTSNKN